MTNPTTTDTEKARAIMAAYVDDEYLATQLGLEDAIAAALAARERETWDKAIDVVERRLRGENTYAKLEFQRKVGEALEAARKEGNSK